MRPRGEWIALAAGVAAAAIGAVFLIRGGGVSPPSPPPSQLTGVAFGANAVYLSERDATGDGLAKLSLPSGARELESRFPSPVRVIGLHPQALWMLSGGVWALSPDDLSVLRSPQDLAALNPQHAARFTAPTGAEVSVEGHLLLPGDPPLQVRPGQWTAQPWDGERPPGPFVHEIPLGSARLELPPTARTPTLHGEGQSVTMSESIELQGGELLLDGRTGKPATLGQPASALVVDQKRERLSRLALYGAVLWSITSERWGGGPVRGVSLHRRALVVWAGQRILGLDPGRGEVRWEYAPGPGAS